MHIPAPRGDVDTSDSDGFEVLTPLRQPNSTRYPNPYSDSDDDLDVEDLVDAAVEILTSSDSEGEMIDSVAVRHTICPTAALLVAQRILTAYKLGQDAPEGLHPVEWAKQLVEEEGSLETLRDHLGVDKPGCKCSMEDALLHPDISATLSHEHYSNQAASTPKMIQDEVRKVFRNSSPSDPAMIVFNATLSPASQTDNDKPSVLSFLHLKPQTSESRFLGLDAVNDEDGRPALRSTASMEKPVAASYAISQLMLEDPLEHFDAYFVTIKPSTESLEELPTNQSHVEAPTSADQSLVEDPAPVNQTRPEVPIPPTSAQENVAQSSQSPEVVLPEDLFPEVSLPDDDTPPPYTELDEAPSPLQSPPAQDLNAPPPSISPLNNLHPEAEREAAAPVSPTPLRQEANVPVPEPTPTQTQNDEAPPEAAPSNQKQKRKTPRKPSAQDWMFSLQNKSLAIPSPVAPAREPTPPPPSPPPPQSPPATASLPKRPGGNDINWMLALQSAPPVLQSTSKKATSSKNEEPKFKQDPPSKQPKAKREPFIQEFKVKQDSSSKAAKARKTVDFAKQAPPVANSSKQADESGSVKVYGTEQLGLLFGSGPRKRPSARPAGSSSNNSVSNAKGKARDMEDKMPVEKTSNDKPAKGGTGNPFANTDAWQSMLLEPDTTSRGPTKGKGKGKQRETIVDTKDNSYRALRNDFAWQVALAATSLKPSDDYLKEREDRTKKLKLRLGQVPFDCLVCFESIEWEDGARMTECEHSFCKDCIEGHIQSKLDENQYPVTCPVCLADRKRTTRGYVEEALIIDLGLPEKLHDRFIELQIAQLSIKIECPGCKNSMQIAREDYLAEAFIWCPLPGCCQQFCRACRQVTKDGGKDHACKIDEALDELMQANGWRYCPGCRTPTQKVSGCNHMTCGAPGCSTHFCYTCGASIWDNRSQRPLADCISAHYSNCVHFDAPNQAPNPPVIAAVNGNVNAQARRRRAAECFHQ